MLLLATVLVAAWPLVAEPAGACVCSYVGDPAVPGSVEEADDDAFAAADVVFVGEAVRVPTGLPAVGHDDGRTLRFEVDEVYKGHAVADQEVVTSRSSCGLEGMEEGEAYVVFAEHPEERQATSPFVPEAEDHQVLAEQCGGTRPLQARAVPTSFGDGDAPAPPLSPEADWEVLWRWVGAGAALSITIVLVGAVLGRLRPEPSD